MKRRSWTVPVGLLAVAAVIVLSFQNCSVRRLQEDVGASAGVDGSGKGPGPDNGSGGGGENNGGAGAPGASCMIQDSTQGTVMGLSGQPPIKTTYATTIRQGPIGAVAASTSAEIYALSMCAPKSQLTNPGKCKDTSGTCVSEKLFLVSIRLKCDNQSDQASACPNFADKIGQEIALSDPTLGSYFAITVFNETDTCDTSGASRSVYMPQLFGAPKVGKFKVTKLDGLADGNVISVELIGVELLKNGTDSTNKVTVDGKYAGEVVTVKACTP